MHTFGFAPLVLMCQQQLPLCPSSLFTHNSGMVDPSCFLAQNISLGASERNQRFYSASPGQLNIFGLLYSATVTQESYHLSCTARFPYCMNSNVVLILCANDCANQLQTTEIARLSHSMSRILYLFIGLREYEVPEAMLVFRFYWKHKPPKEGYL